MGDLVHIKKIIPVVMDEIVRRFNNKTASSQRRDKLSETNKSGKKEEVCGRGELIE